MIARIIRASVAARGLVVASALILTLLGIAAVRTTPVDALPDLSDVQVIVRTSYAGQAPRIVEDQVTYPITTTMLSVPGARVVRGYSFVGDSFVYVLFDDGTDPYWARSRVLEYLSQVQSRLPEGARASIGPDATGVGWIYEYALVDKSGRHDLAELRSLQDWFLRFELKSVPGVAEVASIGGMVRQYQIIVDPQKLAAFGVTATDVADALKRANQESGGGSLELAEAEYIVRASGYLESLDDFRAVPIRTAAGGLPVTVGDVATVQIGPDTRRGIGEVAGGVIVMREGKNAREVIDGVRTKLAELKRSLPPGVEIITTYDRSGLIDRAVDNLTSKLVEEFIIVGLVCALFLWHARSALVAILTLPLGILIAFIVMRLQGLNANILSLCGGDDRKCP
jgi:copper/silver efflux system protein